MDLIVYVNNEYAEDTQMALVDLDTGKVLLQGDYYHDKISDKIDGYIKALYDCHHIAYDKKEAIESWINYTHSMFIKLGFYNPEED